MRINNTGAYEYCRWAIKQDRNQEPTIRDIGPNHWFQNNLQGTRLAMLNAQMPQGCGDCQRMEKHGKVSGRQKQLLKIGVTEQDFVPTLRSSPWLPVFEQSQAAKGHTNQLPQDWQIDLGNFCNSACVFCTPHSSSRLATEYQRLGLIDQQPPRSWVDDPDLIDKFMKDLVQCNNLRYLHFIGGETLITPAFKTILQRLIDHDLNSDVTIGFTTNLTVWRDDVVELLCKFNGVNLGMSIECLHKVNDYARYPSRLDSVKTIMARWLTLADTQGWLPQLRITPTVLTVLHLDTIYRYALQNQVAVESCNFLDQPEFMRPTVLPTGLRQLAIKKLADLDFGTTKSDRIINTRRRDSYREQLQQDCASYIDYLINAPDESHRLLALVQHLKMLESSRGNRVLDYLPEYEELFTTAGY